MLANQGGLEPFFDQPLARPRDRVDTGLQGRRDLAVAPALTTLRGVGFQQDPGLQQLLCWMVSAMDKGGEMLSLLIAQRHYVFLYRDLFPGHQSAPSAATEPSNQTNTADSMTGATSGHLPLCACAGLGWIRRDQLDTSSQRLELEWGQSVFCVIRLFDWRNPS